MRIREAVLAAALLAWATDARAGGLELDVLGARAVGRAGAVTVSADGGAALLVNPAGLARRGGVRLQLGAQVHDSDASFRTAEDDPIQPCDDSLEPARPPTVDDRGAVVAVPSLAFQAGLGRRVVVGAAYLETGDLARELPRPFTPAFEGCDRDVARLFPHRYGGLRLRYQRRTLAAGAGARVLDWLGLGVSVTASRVELAEARHVWAGFDGRDELGAPRRDLLLETSGTDPFVPGFGAGALIAPPQIPFELALSVQLSAAAHLEGDARFQQIHDGPPTHGAGSAAGADLPSPLTARSGLRYLGETFLVEAGAEFVLYPGEAPTWDLNTTAFDETGVEGTLERAPSLIAQRDHVGVRGALEIEAIPTFLWLTAGYAFQSAAAPRERFAPAYADSGGHTLAVGAEGFWRDLTLTIGYARKLVPAVSVSESETELEMLNPFGAGTKTIGAGRYRGGADTFGLQLEVAY